MSLTPQLLMCMSPAHALAALRCEMPTEFMPILDKIEELLPSNEELDLLRVAGVTKRKKRQLLLTPFLEP